MHTEFEPRPFFKVLSRLLFEQAVAGELRYRRQVGMPIEVKSNAYPRFTLTLVGRDLQLFLALYLSNPLSEFKQLFILAPWVVELVSIAEHLIELLGLESPIRDQCLGHFPLDTSQSVLSSQLRGSDDMILSHLYLSRSRTILLGLFAGTTPFTEDNLISLGGSALIQEVSVEHFDRLRRLSFCRSCTVITCA
jgi:hypothetical protein